MINHRFTNPPFRFYRTSHHPAWAAEPVEREGREALRLIRAKDLGIFHDYHHIIIIISLSLLIVCLGQRTWVCFQCWHTCTRLRARAQSADWYWRLGIILIAIIANRIHVRMIWIPFERHYKGKCFEYRWAQHGTAPYGLAEHCAGMARRRVACLYIMCMLLIVVWLIDYLFA